MVTNHRSAQSCLQGTCESTKGFLQTHASATQHPPGTPSAVEPNPSAASFENPTTMVGNNEAALLEPSINMHFPQSELHELPLSLRAFARLSLHTCFSSGLLVDLANRLVRDPGVWPRVLHDAFPPMGWTPVVSYPRDGSEPPATFQI